LLNAVPNFEPTGSQPEFDRLRVNNSAGGVYIGIVSTMTLTDEGSVIERCKKGDREAFASIVQHYRKPAYYVALGYVGRPDDALDLSQDAFVNAFRHIKRFDTTKSFFPWFYSILKNLCMNHLNRIRRRKEDSIDEMEEEEGQVRIPIETIDPEDAVVQKDLEEKIGQAMLRLRPREREIIILQHFQDYSYQEIANLLGLPIGTVMSRLYSARRSLRRELERLGVTY
jgi:RNA polymerase sigma-70 factor, ECF subfamily